MSRRGGGGGIPLWLLLVLILGALVFGYLQRDNARQVLKGLGVVWGSTEGAGTVP